MDILLYIWEDKSRRYIQLIWLRSIECATNALVRSMSGLWIFLIISFNSMLAFIKVCISSYG